jgi:hypothetical protein
MRRARPGALVAGAALALACVALGRALPALAADETLRGLAGLRRVAIDIAFSPAHPGVPVEDLQHRLDEILRSAAPAAPAIDARAPDKLRLTVAVKQYSTSELRGFYLPFSGTYGIGTVRLAVERPVLLQGMTAPPVRAVVWQAERPARAAWRASAVEILSLLEDLAEVFLDDYRQAMGQNAVPEPRGR